MFLPNEIICHIIEHLNYDDFKSFAFVNKNFYELSKYITRHYDSDYENSLYNAMKFLHAFKTVYYVNYKEQILDIRKHIFSLACCENRINIVEFLISRVSEKDLEEAVNGTYIYCSVGLVKLFIRYGINIPELTIQQFPWIDRRVSVLYHACLHGNLEVVKYLVENGCGLEMINEAFLYGKDECRFYLLEKGAICQKPREYEIYVAIKTNQLMLVKCYLQRKFILKKNLCLEFAYCCEELEMAELLTSHGAVSRIGIYDSIEKKHFASAKILKRRGINSGVPEFEEIFDAVERSEFDIIDYYIYRKKYLTKKCLTN